MGRGLVACQLSGGLCIDNPGRFDDGMDLQTGSAWRRLDASEERSMNLRNLKLVGMLLTGVAFACLCSLAQTPAFQPYTLVSGSELTDECPVCDRLPIVLPLAGTFNLRRVDENPLFTHNELTNLAFYAGTNPGPVYQATGDGRYQIGGQVAVLQDLFLNLEISNGVAATKASCVNTDRFVSQPWPKLQINVEQTNGTISQVYYLTLIAVPVPQLRVQIPQVQPGDVRLEWDDLGAKFQLERASSAGGPYLPLKPQPTESPFTDVGVVTNQPQFFYRLRQF